MASRRYGLAMLSVSGFALAPVSALAQNLHISRLYEQVLENINYAAPGHVLDSFGVIRVNARGTVRIELDVPPETSVQVMGDCDEDCLDLDLAVFNGAGKLLGEDRLEDFYPIVKFTSEVEGRIELELDLANCSASYCYTAYSVFIEEPR